MSELLERIAVFERLAAQLEEKLADPEVAKSPNEYATAAKELSQIRPLAEAGIRFRKVLGEVGDAQAMLDDSDPDVRELAQAELDELEQQRDRLEQEIQILLVPKDPNDERSAIVEIRAANRDTDTRAMARRYFGPELGDAYVDSQPDDGSSRVYRMQPERWLTVDYAKVLPG